MIRSPSLRGLVRWMSAGATPAPRWREHAQMLIRARVIVQAYYLIALYSLVGFVQRLQKSAIADPEAFLPQWPVVWMAWLGLPLSAQLLIPLAILSGILGVIWWRRFWVRALVALLLLQLVAFASSWGGVSHGYHELFWLSVCFLFLPDGDDESVDASRALRMKFLTAVGGAIALILLFYTMSGVYKFWDAIPKLLFGEFNGFSPGAMAEILAMRQQQTMTNPIYADIIMDRPLLGWPLFVGLYYVELVAILIFFRPSLHVLWGAILILFHFGTIVFMEVAFSLHILFNAMLFLLSPFAVRHPPLTTIVASLPWFGWPFRRYLGWRSS